MCESAWETGGEPIAVEQNVGLETACISIGMMCEYDGASEEELKWD